MSVQVENIGIGVCYCHHNLSPVWLTTTISALTFWPVWCHCWLWPSVWPWRQWQHSADQWRSCHDGALCSTLVELGICYHTTWTILGIRTTLKKTMIQNEMIFSPFWRWPPDCWSLSTTWWQLTLLRFFQYGVSTLKRCFHDEGGFKWFHNEGLEFNLFEHSLNIELSLSLRVVLL